MSNGYLGERSKGDKVYKTNYIIHGTYLNVNHIKSPQSLSTKTTASTK